MLKYEIKWKKPIQVYGHFTNKYGEKFVNHWFSEYETFEEALFMIKRHHTCPIIIDRQITIGMFNR